jgi:hypothetical protein
MKQFRLLTKVLLVAITACCISGCAGDPRAVLLEPYVETNPSPKAIVGLWNTKKSNWSSTILFRTNGTGLYSWRSWNQWPKDQTESFTYEYIGNGKWRTSAHPGTVFKIAKGQLLHIADWGGGPQVYDRKA